MNINIILIIGFAYTCILSLNMGLYIIKINRKSLEYVHFFLSTIALSFWAFGSMMVQYSTTLESAFFWRRLSSLGVAFFYLFVLHFIINLVYIKKTKLGILMTYLPTLILLYGYFVSTPLAQNQIKIIKTNYGWTTLAIGNVWEYGLMLYYVGYIFGSIALLALWYRSSNDQNDRNTAKNIIIAFIVTFLLGTSIDVIANAFFVGDIPQLGPILSMIPIAMIFLSMIKYGFLLTRNEPMKVEILDDRTHKIIDVYIILITFIASIVNIIAYFITDENSVHFIFLSILLLSVSGIVFILSKNKRLHQKRDLILAIVIFSAIPGVIIPVYLDGITDIWALCVIPIVLLLLFTSKKAFALVTSSILLTQLLICLFEIRNNGGLFEFHYILRFLILIISLKLASYINTVYTNRLKENTYIAYHDSNTDLPNRRYFNEFVDNHINISKKLNKKFYVTVMDIDRFKLINDLLGHDGGDKILKSVSKKLKAITTENEFIAYLGGNTFLLLSHRLINPNIEEFTDDLNVNFKKNCHLLKETLKISMSVGVAEYPTDGEIGQNLLRNADLAMYKAKALGGNQTISCSKELIQEIERTQMITNQLIGAIQRQELYLNYQPKVNCKTNKIEAVEALVRWNNPELGFISPGVFIEIAEKNGLINDIGEYVFNEVCHQVKHWQDSGQNPVPIAVNVSGHQLLQPHVINFMKNAIESNQIDSRFIEIEVTESVAMNESIDISETFIQLKSLGVSIAVDDFGTGYSSLSRLSELPVDVLKIDKKFVDGITKGEKEQSVIKAIIDLAKNLDLKIVAEGVESFEQAEFLKQMNCDFIQGYFYYKPLAIEKLDSLLYSDEKIQTNKNYLEVL